MLTFHDQLHILANLGPTQYLNTTEGEEIAGNLKMCATLDDRKISRLSSEDEIEKTKTELIKFLSKIRKELDQKDLINLQKLHDVTLPRLRLITPDDKLSHIINAIFEIAQKIEPAAIPEPAEGLHEELLKQLTAKLVAKQKGKLTRDRIVTTRQMLALIQNHLPGIPPDEMKNIARALCRQIIQMINKIDDFKGRSLQLKQGTHYPFHIFDQAPTRETPIPSSSRKNLTLPFNCWLEMSENGEKLDLLIFPPNQKVLGAGSHKTVTEAQAFTISFKVTQANVQEVPGIATYQRYGKYTPKILLTVNIDDEDAIRNVRQGIALQKEIQNLHLNSELPSLPREPAPPAAESDPLTPNKQYEQDRYNTDFGKALKTGEIPLDFTEDPPMRPITLSDKFGIVRNIGTALIPWHSAEVAHRDVKPSNILLKVSDVDNGIRGIPADFDLSAKMGRSNIAGSYQYWDTLSTRGLVTPFVDVYGLAVTLGEAVIPEFDMYTPFTYLRIPHTQTTFLKKALAKTPPEQKQTVEATLNLIIEIVNLNIKRGMAISTHDIRNSNDKELLDRAGKIEMSMATFVNRVNNIKLTLESDEYKN